MTRRSSSLVFAAAMLVVATSAHAQLEGQDQEGRILSDRFQISLGGFLASVQTDAAVGFGSNIGTFLRLEDELGLDDDNQTLRLDGFYRFKNKHKLDFSYVDIDRSGNSTIDEPIDFLGVRFQGQVNTEFKSSQYRLVYQYSFANTGKLEAGISAGFSFYGYKLAIAGIGQVLDEETGEPIGGGSAPQEEQEDILAPIPVIGAFINFAINRRTIFRFRSEILDLEIGDLQGKILDTRTTIDWFITKNFGIGGGFTRTDTDVKDSGKNPFSVDYAYGGLLFYIQGVL